MRVSKNRVNESLEKELFRTLHQAIVDLKSPQEVETFLQEQTVEISVNGNSLNGGRVADCALHSPDFWI